MGIGFWWLGFMVLVIFVGAWSGVEVGCIGCVFLLSPQPVNQYDHPRMNRVLSICPSRRIIYKQLYNKMRIKQLRIIYL